MGFKTIKVTSLDEADECLSLIVQAATEIKRIEAERDEKIIKARNEVAEDLVDLRLEIEQHEIALQDFGDNNKELFKEPRSHDLTFGTIGFHKGTKLETLKKWTWKKVLVKLLKLKKRSALRFKPEVNKEKLKTWDDEQLKKIGVGKVEEDHFSYSLKDQ